MKLNEFIDIVDHIVSNFDVDFPKGFSLKIESPMDRDLKDYMGTFDNPDELKDYFIADMFSNFRKTDSKMSSGISLQIRDGFYAEMGTPGSYNTDKVKLIYQTLGNKVYLTGKA